MIIRNIVWRLIGLALVPYAVLVAMLGIFYAAVLLVMAPATLCYFCASGADLDQELRALSEGIRELAPYCWRPLIGALHMVIYGRP